MIATRDGMRLLGLAVVAVAFCAPLFVGLGLTDLNGDEAMHSYAAERMLETGDWLNPVAAPTTDVVFLDKPPLKFWIWLSPSGSGCCPTTSSACVSGTRHSAARRSSISS